MDKKPIGFDEGQRLMGLAEETEVHRFVSAVQRDPGINAFRDARNYFEIFFLPGGRKVYRCPPWHEWTERKLSTPLGHQGVPEFWEY